MTVAPAPSLLVVGLDVPADSECASYVSADSPGRALELMKLLRVDLVVVPNPMDDMPLATFVRYMRMVSPWQKWVMAAGSQTSGQDESAARCHGALAVLDDLGDWSEVAGLARTAQRRSPTRLVAGLDG